MKPTTTERKRRPPNRRGDASWKSHSDQWKENHGTLLMSFAAAIVLIGVAILAFQQSRFRKPAFPAASTFKNAAGEIAANGVSSTYLADDGLAEGGLAGGERIDGPRWRLRIAGAVAEVKPEGGGLIRIALYDSGEHFNQSEFAVWKTSLAVPSTGQIVCDIPLDPLPSTFAIAVFQDTNENGQLDRNVMGMPTERYGFSNAARGTIGPPEFEEAIVDRPAADDEIELKIW